MMLNVRIVSTPDALTYELQGGQKKVYDCVCSLHLVINRFYFVIFSFCIPNHIICFKQTFFFMQQKKRYVYLKNLKNQDLKNQKK